MSRVLLFAAILSTVAIWGCVKQPQLIDTDNYREASSEESKSYLLQAQQQAAAIHSLRALITARIKHLLSEETLTQVLVFERPDKLRLELFATNLNRLVVLISCHQGQLQAADPINHRLYQGAADYQNINKLLSLPFSGEELMLWAAGRPPLLSSESLPPVSVKVEKSETRVYLSYAAGGGREFQMLFALQSGRQLGRLLALDAADAENNRFSTTFHWDAGLDSDNIELPRELKFSLDALGLRGVFHLTEARVNPDLTNVPEALFSPVLGVSWETIDLNRLKSGEVSWY